MGTWEVGAFDNDGAMDWMGEFLDDPSMDAVREALNAVITAESRYDADTFVCECAIAAAEVVAAAAGKPLPGLPEELAAWLKQARPKAPPRLLSMAEKAVARVRTDSELMECWEDSDSVATWHAAMDDLAARLA
ncbi:MAG: DUF4259 domain-containing protein [Phycisphaeraceae bacterium]|nr:DUF4259 domain-containing protein [Phycisphaeraceae bacterium]